MDESTLPESLSRSAEGGIGPPQTLALVVAFARDEPERVGEIAMLPLGDPGPWRVLGRGDARSSDPHARLRFVRIRPGSSRVAEPLGSSRISRVQLLLRGHRLENIEFQNVGRCQLSASGKSAQAGHLRPGELLQLGGQLLLLCSVPPAWLPELPGYPPFDFGEPDALGMIGESYTAWSIRREIVLGARESEHVLITGESGTGKELAAKGIHALSARRSATMVARNAATFPEALIDAELFGNTKNYPNPGMADRPGLIGQADGSTLFLDEIGDLPQPLQSHLLRVLDRGEYQRLGESSTRRADVRVIAATNRPLAALKHDLLARFKVRLHLPNLNARREDIPLVLRHLLRSFENEHRRAASDPAWSLSAETVRHLLIHHYTTHVRELELMLRNSVLGLRHADCQHGQPQGESSVAIDGDQASVSAEQIRAALARYDGIQERAWRALGLSSRHALGRLMRKYGIRS